MKLPRRKLLLAPLLVSPTIWAQNAPTVTAVVNYAGAAPVIAPNTWITILGQNLTKGSDTRVWQGSDFVNSQMPIALDTVSVTVNGVNAFVEYISPVQINILTAPASMPASVQVVVTKNGQSSQPFTVSAQALSPAFFLLNGGPYIAAQHGDYSVVGAADLYPGISHPATPGETIAMYATGFGPTSVPVVSGAVSQGGTLTTLPTVRVGGQLATVTFAGLVYPGEFQINIQLPSNLPTGDAKVVATYQGVEAAPVALLSIQGSGAAPSTVTLYVSPNGNDFWSGQIATPNSGGTDGPLASFDRARILVQTIDKTGVSQINVQFRGGSYYLPGPENFTSADSGSPNLSITYQNYSGEVLVFSGGMQVQNWTNVSGNKWQTTLPAGTQLFENLFYNGARRLRPRLGSGTAGSGDLGVYYRFVGPGSSPTESATCDVPNGDGTYECFDRFVYDPISTPISGSWKNLAAAAGNLCNQPAGNQAIAGDIEVLDWEQFNTPKLRISCIDTANHLVYLTGLASKSQNKPTQVGFIATDRFVIENVQDAFTQPGQWFLDHSGPSLILTYLANANENPNNDAVIAPQLSQLLVASGLQYVTFRGFTFEHDNYVIPPAGHQSEELEPDISAAVSFQNSQYITLDSGTVTQISGTGLEFIACRSSNSPAYCVSNNQNAAVTNDVIENSAVYDVGVLGIRIGVPFITGDTDANVPQFMTIQNNVVEGYGRVIPASFGIGQGMGHDNLYTHNDVYDGYHCAISISSQMGDTTTPTGIGNANNIISFNHVYNLLQGIMNDGGSIRIEAGNESFTAGGNKILNNKIHDVTDAGIMDNNGYGGDGIYLDNSTGLTDVENNLVYRVSEYDVYTPHGPAAPNQQNVVKNNILAYGQKGMIAVNFPYYGIGVPPQANQVFNVTNNLFYFDQTSTSSPKFFAQNGCVYSAGFPYTEFMGFNSNMYWRADGLFASDKKAFMTQPSAATCPGINNPPCANSVVGNTFYTFAQWQSQLGEDLQSVVQNPNFKSVPADDYSLPSGSPGVGFVPFDVTLPGRTNAALTPPVIPETFVTSSYSTSAY